MEPDLTEINKLVESCEWYHTIDLGNGIVTPGHYDHRPYLEYYCIPNNLSGKTILDIGAASGFFSFEFERRGGMVTATDLPDWFDHDFGPVYEPDQTPQSGDSYLHKPFEIAKKILGSQVNIKYINIYDISPETLGFFDLVFCGSVLIHLTDPIRALWNIANITKSRAIIATVITKEEKSHPIATFTGHLRGDTWWSPTRTCLELMAVCAGFVGIEWVNEFQLNYRGQSHGPYHGIMHAYKTTDNWSPNTKHKDEIVNSLQNTTSTPYEIKFKQLEKEIVELKSLVTAYQQRRSIRFTQWIHDIIFDRFK